MLSALARGARAHLAQLIALVFIALLGAVGASAATLGGLRTDDLGAADGATLSHSSGLSMAWGARWSGAALVLDTITVTTATGQGFSTGELLEATVLRSAGTTICTIDYTVPSAATTLTVPRTTIDAACGTGGVAYSTIDRVALSATATVAP